MPETAYRLDPRRGEPRASGRRMPGSRAGFRNLGILCLVLLAVACEDVVVTPADISSIEVVPAEVQVTVGGNTTLAADTKDDAGRSVSGYQVSWTSDDEEIAAVSSSGRVTGAASGTTTIRARVGGVEGAATVRVLGAPVIQLSRSVVTFSVETGGTTAPEDVAITNGGEAALTGLETEIDYSGGGSGWLSAALSRSSAPATLTLAVNAAGLDAGEYRAEVTISSGSTRAAAVVLPVLLEVEELVIQGEPPAAPSELSATGTLTSIQLDWTANSDDETRFEIHRRQGSGSHQQIGTVGAGVTSFTDSDVEVATTYGYRVRACNDHGCSAFSAEATGSVLVPDGLSAPTNLRIVFNQRHRVRIAWDSPNPVPVAVRIERARGSGSFSVIATTDIGDTFYDDRSVEPTTTYSYRVSACNVTGCSGTSSTVTVTTPQ